MRKQVRGVFQVHLYWNVLKCALLLAMMMVRKGGRQEAEGTLSGGWGGWGDQQKVGHSVLLTQMVQRWFIADVLGSSSSLSLPGLLQFQYHSTSSSTKMKLLTTVALVFLVLLSVSWLFIVCQFASSASTEVQVRRLYLLILLGPVSVQKKRVKWQIISLYLS